jgi:hypothetical protein
LASLVADRNSAVLEGKMVFPEIKIPDESNYSADDWYVFIADLPM